MQIPCAMHERVLRFLVFNTLIISHLLYKKKGYHYFFFVLMAQFQNIRSDLFIFSLQCNFHKNYCNMQYLKIMLYYSWLKCLKSKWNAVIVAKHLLFICLNLSKLNSIENGIIVKIYKTKEIAGGYFHRFEAMEF